MERTVFVCIFLLAAAIATNPDPIKVNMDSAGDCGTEISPLPSQPVMLTSTGKAPGSYCNVRVYVDNTPPKGCKYSALCLKVTFSQMTDCVAKADFTGKMYDGTKDQTRELSCYQPFGVDEEWCVPSNLFVAEVSSIKYDKNTQKRNYAFNATVFTMCKDRPLPKIPLNPDNEYKMPDQVEADNYNRLIGIIVGLSLCSVFLVILVITYCFNRNRAYRPRPSESKEQLKDVGKNVGLAAKHKPTPTSTVMPTKFSQSIDIRL